MQTKIMGILNITPDSFSDGGDYNRLDKAIQRAEAMVEDGATLLDVGGESSRPGAMPVPLDQELERVLPVVAALCRRFDRSNVTISIDTTKVEVAARACEAGAGIINDISGLSDARMRALVAKRSHLQAVIMHMLGEPRMMQDDPSYADVVGEVADFFEQRIECCMQEGIDKRQLIVDPGIGFGKRLEDNLHLLRDLDRFNAHGCPILLGASRKAFIGTILDAPVSERLEGTLAAHVVAVMHGASVLRVHDVKAAVRATRVAEAIVRS